MQTDMTAASVWSKSFAKFQECAECVIEIDTKISITSSPNNSEATLIRSTLFPAENESKSKHFFSIFVTLSTSSNSTFMSGNSNSLCFVNFLVLYFPIVESIGIIMMTLKKTGMKSIYRIVPFWLMWFLHLSLSLCVFAYYRFVDSNKSEIIADNSVFYIFYNISRFTWYITFNFSFIAC